MIFADTHTHLYLDDFSPENEEVVRRAIVCGVEKLIFPNVDLSTIEPMKHLHKSFPQNTFMAMGLHPTEVRETWEKDLAETEKELKENISDYVAVGEIGIDLYWDKTFIEEQKEVFRRQAQLAVDLDLPIIIHCREGLKEILDVLHEMPVKPKGVFHCFCGDIADVEAIREIGDYYFGIGGVVTFKKSTLKDVLPTIGIDRILLETDSPYLTPVPHRGGRNESAYIPDIAAFIAKELGIELSEVASRTTNNCDSLFKI